MEKQEEQPARSRRAVGGDSLVTYTVAGDKASETADADRLPNDEKLGVLSGGRGQPQPTYPNGHWRHWTDDL
jgi:hypothetical protein